VAWVIWIAAWILSRTYEHLRGGYSLVDLGHGEREPCPRPRSGAGAVSRAGG